jgi:hypothetical protein
MILAHIFHHPSRAVAGCCLLALSACSSQELNHQLATSREAVDQAQMAGAEENAPADFGAAADKLARANAAATGHNKHDAMRLAQQAQVDANLARARSESTQARLAATELTRTNQTLRDAINRANQNQ